MTTIDVIIFFINLIGLNNELPLQDLDYFI